MLGQVFFVLSGCPNPNPSHNTCFEKELMLSNCGAGEDSWESLGQQDQTSQSWRKSTLNIHWKDWCWSWSSNTLAIWCEEPTQQERSWCWERLKAEGERMREDEMAGWHHWLKGHEFERTLRDSEEEGSLACWSPWGCKEPYTTEPLNSNVAIRILYMLFSLQNFKHFS